MASPPRAATRAPTPPNSSPAPTRDPSLGHFLFLLPLSLMPIGRPQGPTHHILSPLAPTIRRIGPHSPCIVGAGQDVDVGMGPWWLPVRALHRPSSPSLKGIDHKVRPYI